MVSSFDFWGKGSHKGTPVVVKMENSNWSMFELEGPSKDDFLNGTDNNNTPTGPREKARNKNAKQLTWVLLLKAHRSVDCLTSIASTFVTLDLAIRNQVKYGRTDADSTATNENKIVKAKLYNCLKVFLWLSVLLLCFEIAAYFKGWHFDTPKLQLQFVFTTPLKEIKNGMG